MGLQHAMAMTGGIVLGPIIVASANPNINITQCKLPDHKLSGLQSNSIVCIQEAGSIFTKGALQHVKLITSRCCTVLHIAVECYLAL